MCDPVVTGCQPWGKAQSFGYFKFREKIVIYAAGNMMCYEGK